MASRPPVFRISMANATGIAALYLLVASAVEVVRRTFNFRWSDAASHVLEQFPARVLHLLGLSGSLRERYLAGEVGELTIRLVYGATVVAVVFLVGVLVGALLWLLARLLPAADSEDEADDEPR